ncbi:hypothetical protein [Aeromicrobium sp. UC242_57]|uniref:hypothetical protein n=1 Tax=Aeromicrobium sp. UC242_57 TaxID=3374624 RepID=UPI0037B6D8E8
MSEKIYDFIFRVAEVLELPVVILTLLALAAVLVEVGAFITEPSSVATARSPLWPSRVQPPAGPSTRTAPTRHRLCCRPSRGADQSARPSRC